ncbi:hypothetical protein K3495_g520 [Podosphaera aphanis]|nr:hypothetical protein K3495_g520 [Podosphaera aphanis]
MFSSNFLVTFVTIFTFNSVVHTATCWRQTKCTGPSTAAFPGSWDQFNFSPSSRTISPASIISRNSTFISSYPEIVEFSGNGSLFVFDFEKLVAGIVRVTYSTTGLARLGLAFSEAKNWIGNSSDSSNGSFNPDGALYAELNTTTEAEYEMPLQKLRGGFRYLSLFEQTASDAVVRVLNVTVEISFQPDWPDLRAYKGYFSCSDDLLTKIWYSGAYTLQTNAIPPSTGREFPILGSSWANDADLSHGISGSTVYVDGAKRDRTVWPGDLGVAVPSILVSTGDWEGVKTTLNILYASQADNGELPFAGPQINIYRSDTYHMATLIGTYDYFLWTNDTDWMKSIYEAKFKKAMSFITQKIDNTNMLNVTGTEDWGRIRQGGHNTEANLLLYNVLVGGSKIAAWMDDSVQATKWSELSASLRISVNQHNYDTTYGAYKDTDIDSSIYPQDANSLALLYRFSPQNHTQGISTALTKNWINIGSLAPELPNNLVGFGQSLEVKGHFAAHQASRALDLIRRAWGWYINNPLGTASTCIEGYRADGTFGYRAETGYDGDYSYTSHSHGWSTGPTDGLTSYIVGLTVTAPGGSKWEIAPQFADLSYAEAGFSTPIGKFSAKWSLVEGGFVMSWIVPVSTQGLVIIPLSARKVPTLIFDDQILNSEEGSIDIATSTFSLLGQGGNHTLQVKY